MPDKRAAKRISTRLGVQILSQSRRESGAYSTRCNVLGVRAASGDEKKFIVAQRREILFSVPMDMCEGTRRFIVLDEP